MFSVPFRSIKERLADDKKSLIKSKASGRSDAYGYATTAIVLTEESGSQDDSNSQNAHH